MFYCFWSQSVPLYRMVNKERSTLNISAAHCLILSSNFQCIYLVRMFFNGELGTFSYTKRFRLLSKMEHLYGYIMRLYGDLNCVRRNWHQIKSKIELQWRTCVLSYILSVCISAPTTVQEVCPRSLPSTSIKILRIKYSLYWVLCLKRIDKFSNVCKQQTSNE